MDNLALIGGLAGGVGLFLLGMELMTAGLKLAAGPMLERILATSTRTRWRGLAAGALVTSVVQSSSAVTVATIGFVNAGLLNLSQALWVLFGANVGTTMTGWLVALVGLKFKIEAIALPLVGIGMVMRLTGEGSRRASLGMALAGFGVLFLGIDMLRETFSGLASTMSLPEGSGMVHIISQVAIGLLMTVLMQSSSAALTIALTAAQGGLLTAQGAAAVVIGANIGTTVTALLAAIGATPNAKRAAAAHILFNVLTGFVALLLLPWLILAISGLRDWLGLDSAPAATLALFHTIFNVLGVLLIWPIAGQLAHFLQSRFRSQDEHAGEPRYLDRNILAVPALALDALEREVRHMGDMAIQMLRSALAPAARKDALITQQQAVMRLNRAIADFVTELSRNSMTEDSARRLPVILRLARYYETAAELVVEAVEAGREIPAHDIASLQDAYSAFRQQTELLLSEPDSYSDGAYQLLKAQLLSAGANGSLAVTSMDARLRAASALRRATEQCHKAARLLKQDNTVIPSVDDATGQKTV